MDLDNIFWDNTAQSYGVKMSVEKRNALLQEVLSKDDWIIEGVYYTWLQQSFEDSDKIYVLNMPRYLYLTRIVIRFLKRKIGLEKGKKESLQSLFALIKWTDCFQNKNLKEIRQILDPYGDKVIWISKKSQLRNI